MGISSAILAKNAHAHLQEKIHGLPGAIIPRGAKGVAGAPAVWNQTRVPHAGRVTGNGDTPIHPLFLSSGPTSSTGPIPRPTAPTPRPTS